MKVLLFLLGSYFTVLNLSYGLYTLNFVTQCCECCSCLVTLEFFRILSTVHDPLQLVFTLSQNSEMIELFSHTAVSFGIFTPSKNGVRVNLTRCLPGADSSIFCFSNSRFNERDVKKRGLLVAVSLVNNDYTLKGYFWSRIWPSTWWGLKFSFLSIWS